MENTHNAPKSIPQTDIEEVVIGNTTYIVSSNAKDVPKEFVKKTVKKLLFNDLTQKS